VGLRESALTAGDRVTVSVADLVTPPAVAEMDEFVFAVTGSVVMGNVANVAPAGTVTAAGTVAAVVRLLRSVTVVPPGGAAMETFTLPTDGAPPTTLEGVRETLEAVTTRTERFAERVFVPEVPEIATVVFAATAEVVTVNVAVVLPAAITALAGTLATAPLALASVTVVELGTVLLIRTVPVTDPPPAMAVGLSETVSVRRASAAVREAPDAVAVSVAVDAEVTPVVVTVNGALVAPAGISTVAGRVTAELLSDSETESPPAGAGVARVTVAPTGLPLTTLAAERVRAERAGGDTVSVAARVAPFQVAEMLTGVEVETGAVAIGNVADVAPAAMVTVAGTVAAAELDASAIAAPPAGAAVPMRTVPVELTPPATVVGETVTAVRAGGLIVRLAVRAAPP
jgi:hypothetical protein